MSGTYGFCQTPLKSTLPDGVRGVGPAGGLKLSWAPANAAHTSTSTNAEAIADATFFTGGSR